MGYSSWKRPAGKFSTMSISRHFLKYFNTNRNSPFLEVIGNSRSRLGVELINGVSNSYYVREISIFRSPSRLCLTSIKILIMQIQIPYGVIWIKCTNSTKFKYLLNLNWNRFSALTGIFQLMGCFHYANEVEFTKEKHLYLLRKLVCFCCSFLTFL